MLSSVQTRSRPRAVPGRIVPILLMCFAMLVAMSSRALAAEYAALVMDARNGKVLHASNADTRLHPASLTKMMTLYVAFEAIENGEISLDTPVKISRNAAAEPPSKLGLKAGQSIKLRYLIRAAAIKSANDAATAIAEAIEGSEAAFARRMNRTAKALGMSRTTFKNAHGLTQSGHLSTARDMTVMGRHLFYDYPEYYNIFSRQTANAGVRTVAHTNTRFLNSYKGADGIKTGYTSAAGFNLTASAIRGKERIITTVFGGRSTASRNAKVAELMDLGFKRAPSRVAVNKPRRPAYMGKAGGGAVMVAGNQTAPKVASKIVRVSVNITRSPIPKLRPAPKLAPETELLLAATSEGILDALEQAQEEEAVLAAATAASLEATELLTDVQEVAAEAAQVVQVSAPAPEAAPIVAPAITPVTTRAPTPRPARLQLAAIEPTAAATAAVAAKPEVSAPEVVTRISTSGSRHWGVNVGTYGSEYEARKVLLKTALTEIDMLDGALRKVVKTNRGYAANFLGLTEDMAGLTCRRLEARGTNCSTTGPS